MFGLKLSLLLVAIFSWASQGCEREDSAFSRHNAREKMSDCRESMDQFECSSELGIRAVNLLLNFGYSAGYLERSGKRAAVSVEANQLFENCTQRLLAQMPTYFANNVKLALNVDKYEEECWSKEDICKRNVEFLYPFVCLAREKCSTYLMDATFALIYSHQMISLETNQPLQCTENGEQDLQPGLFLPALPFKRGRILNTRFCRAVPMPPKRVLVETEHDGAVSVSAAISYYWN